jgi:hypothetical protein
MAILMLTSCSGSPGVTTLAVGLALTWPRPVLLADCDPGAHQAVLAGFLAGRAAGGKGLLRVAEAHRDRRALREVVIDQCLPLTDDDSHRRLFLPGFTRAGSAAHFGGVWDELAETFDRLADVGMDVVVDAGRMGAAGGLPAALLERSALTAVVLGSSLRSVMSARVHLPVLSDGTRGAADRGHTGLVLVGAGRPYGSREIGRALGAEVLAELPHEPATAAYFSDGAPQHRKFESSPLVRGLRSAASTFAGALQRSTELVRS